LGPDVLENSPNYARRGGNMNKVRLFIVIERFGGRDIVRIRGERAPFDSMRGVGLRNKVKTGKGEGNFDLDGRKQ